MKTLSKLLGFFAIALFFASCVNRVPYTINIQKKFKLTEKELQGIQFYVSDDIILYRQSSEGSVKTQDGELIIESEKEENKIVINRGTKCVLEQMMGTDKLAIRFEKGDGNFLVFGVTSRSDGKFQLMAEKWVKRHGKLKYGGETFYAKPGSGYAHLLVKLKHLKSNREKQRTVNGMKI